MISQFRVISCNFHFQSWCVSAWENAVPDPHLRDVQPSSLALALRARARDSAVHPLDSGRNLYISIVGWSPSFEPAPGAAQAGLVASRDSEAPPRKGPLSLHVSPAKYMTSGRIKFPKLA